MIKMIRKMRMHLLLIDLNEDMNADSGTKGRNGKVVNPLSPANPLKMRLMIYIICLAENK